MTRITKLTMKHISVIFLFICIICVPACDVSESPPTDPTEMYEKAITLLQEKSYKKAKPLLEHAVASFRDLKKTTQLIEGLLGLVRTNLELCEFRAAFDAAEQATTLIRKEGDIHGEIKLAMFIGDLYAKMHMYNRAVASYRTAASTATAFDDMNAIADARLQLASILKVSGDFDDAQEEYKGVLAQAQVNGDRQRIALALFGIGSVYRMQQRYVEAVNSLTQGLASTSRTRDPLLAARLQMEIGILHAAQNNANVATRDFRDAINILRRTRTNKLYETVILFRLGQLYEQNGRIIEAKRYYNEALELARLQGDHIAENYLYIFLIRCNFNLMTPEQQLQSTEKLLQSYEQIAKKFQECNHITGGSLAPGGGEGRVRGRRERGQGVRE